MTATPSRLRRLGRGAFRCAYWLLGCGLFYFLLVFEFGWLASNRSHEPADDGIVMWVWSNGIHVDFVVPRRTDVIDWGAFAPLERGEPTAGMRNVIIGWGDHDFYTLTRTNEDFSLPRTLKAIFLPTRAVMHMSYWYGEPTAGEGCVRLHLRREEYERFVSFVQTGFARDDHGRLRLLSGVQHGTADVFYHGVGSYHLFNTCNNWANDALRHTGIKTPIWSPFAEPIFLHIR